MNGDMCDASIRIQRTEGKPVAFSVAMTRVSWPNTNHVTDPDLLGAIFATKTAP
jgi:hypothetical protein